MVRRLVAAVAVAVALPATANAQVPNPTVEGPIEGGVRGYPWNKSLFDLEKPDYSEKEYFFGGVATNLSSGLTAPYKSRMLVRLPRDPKDFTGTVTVEWLNVTGQNDLETSWPPAGEYMMEQGVGYVGVSAQLAGVCCGPTTLKGWDATRYATLVHPGDEFSFDIFSQAIEALSDPAHNATTPGSPKQIDPMLGMEPEHIVANGASQSAGRLTTHVNDGYNRGGIDLYTITRGGGPYDDFSTPIFQLNEEGLGELQPDSDSYRAWEEAGTAHAPAAWWNYVWAELQRDHVGAPAPDALNVACAVNRGSVDYSARALAFWTEQYFKNGTLPPSVPRIERDENGDVVRDEHGLAVGGIRHPFIEVPVAHNAAEGCPLWGTYKSWSSEKIKSLYPTHGEYVDQVKDWAGREVKLGWMIPADRDDAIRKAEQFDLPWTAGSCYDTYNQQANETGPLSGPIGQASFEPSLPAGSQAALREANCNAVVPLGL
ncbi:MAG: alpha/beta hydrolase domain-containing protein [Thermoleophilaceae bacterium]